MGPLPPSSRDSSQTEREGLGPVKAQATQAGVVADLQMVVDAARDAGFHVSSRRTYIAPYQYRLALALDQTNARRRGLCWFVPDVDRQLIRVAYSSDNLRDLASVQAEVARSIFGADGDRDWPAGSGERLVLEIVAALAGRLPTTIR